MWLIRNPERRVQSIDFSNDWWFVDNEAKYYFEREGLLDEFGEHIGHRVCMPSDDGDGVDIVEWFDRLPTL